MISIRGLNLKEVISLIGINIGFHNVWDVVQAVVDIVLVSYVIYKVIYLARETRAWQLIKGILIILIASKISNFLGLNTIAFVLNYAVQYIAIALVVLFQPELRRGLEQIGRSKFGSFIGFEVANSDMKLSVVIEEIIEAVKEFSKQNIGALIIFERKTKIGDVINSGIKIDSNISSELIINIFSPNAPLHDGAIIIRNNRIKAAACFLPLSDNLDISKELGTRHRAAIGISEVSDALCIVVSEETGTISFTVNGQLTRNVSIETLKTTLHNYLSDNEIINRKLALWKVKPK